MSLSAVKLFIVFVSLLLNPLYWLFQLTLSISKPRWWVYVITYGASFVLVLLNFSLTVLFLDNQQKPNDPESKLQN